MKALRRRLERLEGSSGEDQLISSIALVRKDALRSGQSVEVIFSSAGLFFPNPGESDEVLLDRVRATEGHNRGAVALSDSELERAHRQIDEVCNLLLENEDAVRVVDISTLLIPRRSPRAFSEMIHERD